MITNLFKIIFFVYYFLNANIIKYFFSLKLQEIKLWNNIFNLIISKLITSQIKFIMQINP